MYPDRQVATAVSSSSHAAPAAGAAAPMHPCVANLQRMIELNLPTMKGAGLDYAQLLQARHDIQELVGGEKLPASLEHLAEFINLGAAQADVFMQTWRTLSVMLGELRHLLAFHGITNVWLVGARAAGANRSSVDKFELLIDDTFEFRGQPGHLTNGYAVAAEIADFWAQNLGMPVQVEFPIFNGPLQLKKWRTLALPLFSRQAPLYLQDKTDAAQPHRAQLN